MVIDCLNVFFFGRIRIWIVVRDYDGIVVAAHSTTKNFMVEPVVAEAFAAFHAMELRNVMRWALLI
jgi:hypothetical protein